MEKAAQRSIGELTAYIGSGATPRGGRAVYVDRGVPFIRSQNVRDGRLDLRGAACITPAVHAEMARSAVRPGDVLLNITGASIGRSCVVPDSVGQANVNQHVCILRGDGQVLPGYMQAMLETRAVQQAIRDVAAGGSREGLNYQQVATLRIPWICIPEQQLLVRIRESSEPVEGTLGKLLDSKRGQACALRRELTTGTRHLCKSGEHASWPTRALGDVASSVARRNTTGIALVLTCSGERGLIDQRDFFSKHVAGESREGYFLLRRGEFAYNRSAMTGYPYGAIKRLDAYDAGALSTLNICFALSGDAWLSDFAVHVFASGILNRQLARIARVGSRAHGLLNVTKADFFALQVPVPPVEEQRRIASFLNALDREIALLGQLRAAYAEQKRGLMQRLLAGDLPAPAHV